MWDRKDNDDDDDEEQQQQQNLIKKDSDIHAQDDSHNEMINVLTSIKSGYFDQNIAEDLFTQPITNGHLGLSVPYVDRTNLLIYKRNKLDSKIIEDDIEEQLRNKVRAQDTENKIYDGLYGYQIQDTELLNKHRLENQLLQEEQYQYFDDDGELIIDRDFFEEKILKMYIVDYEENPILATTSRSATHCARSNQNKGQPYKLDIFIGELEFSYHPLFEKEDKLVSDLRYLIKKYRKRSNLCLLPHLKKIRDILQKEVQELQNRSDYPKSQIQNIQSELENTQNLFKEEKELLSKLMESIYGKWKQVKEQQIQQKYVGSPYKLVVRQYQSNENTNEVEFLLQMQSVDEQNSNVGVSEMRRRNSIKQYPIQIQILINNVVIASTRKQFLKWPTFRVGFMQKIQLYVYSKPSTIKFRIVHAKLLNQVIDTIEVEIPGEKSNSITSSGVVLKEAYFAQGREQIRKKRFQSLVKQGGGGDIDDIEIGQVWGGDEFEGFLSYRTEWIGFGSSMPPDSMDMKYDAMDQKFEDEEYDMNVQLLKKSDNGQYFDVNDPRNEDLMIQLQKQEGMNSKQINSITVPYNNIISLRQRLLKMRYIVPELSKRSIPMWQEAIRKDAELMRLIENENKLTNYEVELDRQQDGDVKILEDFIIDPQTKKRLMDIFNILKQRKIEAILTNSNNSQGQLSLDSVVNEFHFEEAASLLAWLIKSIFTKQRPLAPQKALLIEKKALTQIKEVSISCLIIQAKNVPIRTATKSQLFQIHEGMKDEKKIKESIQNLQKIRNVSSAVLVNLELDNLMVIDKKFILEEITENIKDKQYNSQQNNNSEQIQDIDEDKYKLKEIQETKKQKSEMTSEIEGVNPEWNELIEFTIGPDQEPKEQFFNAIDIINSRNRIVLTLFDQMGSIRQEPNNVDRYNLVIQRQYIGQITIPLMTLFQQEKLSGTFKIDRPIMLIGYQNLKVDQFLNNSDKYNKDDQIQTDSYNITDPFIPTTVELSITLDPIPKLNQKFAPTDYFPGKEQTNLFLYGVRLLERIKADPLLKTRNIKFWAENLKGESVFLPRFLTPLNPPLFNYEGESKENAIQKVARFVSLIPFKNDTEHFRDLPDIYCDCQEFLDLRAGDFEEHAILLCCYFMHIDPKYKSYIVMGRGIPEGNTQYVMRRQKGSQYVEIWNPQTAEPYIFQKIEEINHIFGCFRVSKGYKNLNDMEDHACPLTSIGCVIDNENVYINIQKNDNPSEISFDIEDRSKWEPFLNSEKSQEFFPKNKATNERKIQTIQKKELIYDEIDHERSAEVQKQVELYLKQQIENHRRTNFAKFKSSFQIKFINQQYAELTNYIYNLLLQLESFKFRIRTTGLASNAEDQNRTDSNKAQQAEHFNNKLNDYKESLAQLDKFNKDIHKNMGKYIKDQRKMYGFPLNFTYIDLPKAWDQVKATGISDILSDDIEYVCKVRCFPYPHYLISCWVFIAVIYRNEALE